MTKQAKAPAQIVLYENKDKQVRLQVQLRDDTIWLSQKEIADLFGVQVPAVSRHLANIYASGELVKRATISKMETVQKEGKRTVNRSVDAYNLDAIIAVGYRVNSRRATHFRMWSTSVLRDYVLKGYALNQHQLEQKRLKELEADIGLIKGVIEKAGSLKESKGLLDVITGYTRTWLLLRQYDDQSVPKMRKGTKPSYVLTYKQAQAALAELKSELIDAGEASDLFAQERGSALKAIVGNIYQTFDKKELYPSVEAKAAHLLYFLIKDHPFSDGNKRSAAFLFIHFLAQNKHLVRSDGELRINDNALVALALLIAESDPQQKEVMIRLIIRLIAGE